MDYIKILLCYLFFVFFPINSAMAYRPDWRPKGCQANIRMIQGAIEMYNMSNSEMIKHLDSKTMDLLEKKEYLKDFSKPQPECEYKSIGNLNANGIIYCKYHGDIEHLVYCDYYKDCLFLGDKYKGFYSAAYKKFSQNATDEEIRKNIDIIRKNKKKAIESAELKNKISFYMPFLLILLTPIIIIWSFSSSRKNQS